MLSRITDILKQKHVQIGIFGVIAFLVALLISKNNDNLNVPQFAIYFLYTFSIFCILYLAFHKWIDQASGMVGNTHLTGPLIIIFQLLVTFGVDSFADKEPSVIEASTIDISFNPPQNEWFALKKSDFKSVAVLVQPGNLTISEYSENPPDLIPTYSSRSNKISFSGTLIDSSFSFDLTDHIIDLIDFENSFKIIEIDKTKRLYEGSLDSCDVDKKSDHYYPFDIEVNRIRSEYNDEKSEIVTKTYFTIHESGVDSKTHTLEAWDTMFYRGQNDILYMIKVNNAYHHGSEYLTPVNLMNKNYKVDKILDKETYNSLLSLANQRIQTDLPISEFPRFSSVSELKSYSLFSIMKIQKKN